MNVVEGIVGFASEQNHVATGQHRRVEVTSCWVKRHFLMHRFIHSLLIGKKRFAEDERQTDVCTVFVGLDDFGVKHHRIEVEPEQVVHELAFCDSS